MDPTRYELTTDYEFWCILHKKDLQDSNQLIIGEGFTGERYIFLFLFCDKFLQKHFLQYDCIYKVFSESEKKYFR